MAEDKMKTEEVVVRDFTGCTGKALQHWWKTFKWMLRLHDATQGSRRDHHP